MYNEVKVCNAALRLMLQILNWDFRYNNNSTKTSINVFSAGARHVVYLLLKFVVAWVNGQIAYLEAHETAVVVDFCMHLLQLYSSHNIGKDARSFDSVRSLRGIIGKMCHKMDADRWEEMLAEVARAIHLNFSDGIILVINGEEKTKAI
ncbi:hypothetical protein FH972_012903 [Carpinus fangiana]|uniref:Uncharacterized protein n=1 Tax=Carpinus fangiana TaxID=176857 RepID=A0A5N6R8J4_9ROSI|nr:hypothetical protein FH972_012903 [Carpinus fangiana]